ncbi:hypothetical protein OESDEN_04957 [Oesophagostomum dentatum]|uniref:WAP domain-containing protein n=1 Tax=Oesophagostomum dentatum TaxID=61180 RepID=A0A0B1TCV2_OESDE|nr:hypothetical protein OESDEN_04957 [Oesophagostomum dentatum]
MKFAIIILVFALLAPPHCPHLGMPKVPPGCHLERKVDENNCPRAAVVCP